MPKQPSKGVPLARVAYLLDETHESIEKMVAKEGLKRISKDQYDVAKTIRWYVARQRKQLNEEKEARNDRTVGEVAEMFGVTVKWINRLVSEKGLPRKERGVYDLFQVIPWMVRDMKRQIEEAKAGDESMQDAVKREQMMKADILEIKLARQRSEVINVSDASNIMRDLVAQTKAAMMAQPRKLAPLLVMKESPNEVETILESEIHAVLSELSALPDTIRSLTELPAIDPDGLEDVPAAEAAHAEPVGGGGESPVKRKRKRNRPMAQ